MMKRKILLIAGLFTLCSGLFAKGDTYIYDYWGKMEKSPDAYRVSHVIYADDLALDKGLKNPSSLFAHENMIYVADTDNNRILQLEYTKQKTLELRRVIDHINTNGMDIVDTLNLPEDVFIGKDNTIYIADTKNGRILHLDQDLNVLQVLKEPVDPTYETGKDFLPTKVVADSKGRVYASARNINKGFLKYEYDGTFQGFFGANEVVYKWEKAIGK